MVKFTNFDTPAACKSRMFVNDKQRLHIHFAMKSSRLRSLPKSKIRIEVLKSVPSLIVQSFVPEGWRSLGALRLAHFVVSANFICYSCLWIHCGKGSIHFSCAAWPWRHTKIVWFSRGFFLTWFLPQSFGAFLHIVTNPKKYNWYTYHRLIQRLMAS